MPTAHKVIIGFALLLLWVLVCIAGDWSKNGRYFVKSYKNEVLVLDTRTGAVYRQRYDEVPAKVSDQAEAEPIPELMEAYIDGY